MKNITHGLLVATALLCFGFGVVSNAGATTYVKGLRPNPGFPNDHPNLNGPGGSGDTNGPPIGHGRDDNVVVPEPGTLILLGAGLTGLAAARRKRRQG